MISTHGDLCFSNPGFSPSEEVFSKLVLAIFPAYLNAPPLEGGSSFPALKEGVSLREIAVRLLLGRVFSSPNLLVLSVFHRPSLLQTSVGSGYTGEEVRGLLQVSGFFCFCLKDEL